MEKKIRLKMLSSRSKSSSVCAFFSHFSALFLVEAGNEKLWLWQGWWPDVGHEVIDTNMSIGSGIIRSACHRIIPEPVDIFVSLASWPTSGHQPCHSQSFSLPASTKNSAEKWNKKQDQKCCHQD